jgi:hypothetical protein
MPVARGFASAGALKVARWPPIPIETLTETKYRRRRRFRVIARVGRINLHCTTQYLILFIASALSLKFGGDFNGANIEICDRVRKHPRHIRSFVRKCNTESVAHPAGYKLSRLAKVFGNPRFLDGVKIWIELQEGGRLQFIRCRSETVVWADGDISVEVIHILIAEPREVRAVAIARDALQYGVDGKVS